MTDTLTPRLLQVEIRKKMAELHSKSLNTDVFITLFATLLTLNTINEVMPYAGWIIGR